MDQAREEILSFEKNQKPLAAGERALSRRRRRDAERLRDFASSTMFGAPVSIRKCASRPLMRTVTIGNGSVWTGNSQITLLAASIGSGGAVRIYDLVVDAAPSPGAGSMPGDAYTDCLVVWNWGVSRWQSAA